jgi:thymidylate kinase
MVFYFSVMPETSGRRIAADRTPKFYEAGQDVTGIEDPHLSYQKFVRRTIQEYSALAAIFEFITVDADRSVYDQHMMLRRKLQQGQRRSWIEHDAEAIADWLASRPEVRLG